MKLKFYTACFLILLVFTSKGYAQSYGLGFAGHQVVQDKRTGVNLSVEQPICLDKNFELSFDLSFMPGYADYFGYVFRMIDNDGRNIDLVYDMRFFQNKHFKLIIGNKVSDIAFDIDIKKLYKNWFNLKFLFDAQRQQITLKADGKTYTQRISLANNCYKILLGANDYKNFKITDVPPMKIREVKIKEENELSYYWPLDEKSGFKVAEKVKGKDGSVSNPIWIKKLHYDWDMVKAFSVKGSASVAFDAAKEELFIIADDSLIRYNPTSNQAFYQEYLVGKQGLLPGNQSLYNGKNGELLNFYMDQKLLTKFDFKGKKWGKKYKYPDTITGFWHPNKFYSQVDSSLYMIDGYGQYTYRRNVYRYHFPDQKWSEIKVNGDFMPRYLSALGAVKDGAYILGGYGSVTGQQILNPKNIYDLNFFDVRKRTFRKLFEIKPYKEDFAFANSMIIDEKTKTYHALIFPNDKYDTYLQLIEGSLDDPSYKFVGSQIPYAFHDIRSFADLFYCPGSEKYIAVTLLHDEKLNRTSIKVFTLQGPPEILAQLPVNMPFNISKYWWLIIVLSIAGLFVFYKWGKFKHRDSEKVNLPLSAKPIEVVETQPVVEGPIATTQQRLAPNLKNSVFLFGDMQLFDKEGEDITKSLTPLIRELFLVVLLYTIKGGRGISSEKLTEILWFDKSADSARNNRSVNIAKLKVILEKFNGCQISKTTGYWKIDFDPNLIDIDYNQYLNIVKSKGKIERNRLDELTSIIHRGSFLSNVEYDWLDGFKSEISNEIIDTYLQYAANIKVADDPEFLINLANYVFCFDPVNEEAMVINCKALVHLGKHSLAKAKFETFSKAYKSLYNADFEYSFNDILSSNISGH